MQVLPLMILPLVKDVLWHMVRIPIFQEPRHFTLSFLWIRSAKTMELSCYSKAFLTL